MSSGWFHLITASLTHSLTRSLARLSSPHRMTTTIDQNINEDTSVVALSAEELKGLPAAFIADLEPSTAEGGGKQLLSVGLKAPQSRPVLQLAESSETRRKVLTAR